MAYEPSGSPGVRHALQLLIASTGGGAQAADYAKAAMSKDALRFVRQRSEKATSKPR